MTSEGKVSAGQRRQMVAEAAYFRAERRGFNGGDTVRDWCEAEAEVDARLRQVEEGQLVERIEEVVTAASKKLATVRRKVVGLSADARGEWQKDIDKLAKLRDALVAELAELREQGEQAGHTLRVGAEKIRAEVAEVVNRLGAKTRH
jgi:hypothetical protein